MVMAPSRAKVILQKAAEDVSLRFQIEPIREDPVDDQVIPVPLKRLLDMLAYSRFLSAVRLDVGIQAEYVENFKRLGPEALKMQRERVGEDELVGG